MSTTNEPNFDWSQAASLLGDDPHKVEADMAAIVRELVESADGQFRELKVKNAATERKEIAAQAHQLRGCLLNFGFAEVGTILLQIETGGYTAGEYGDLLEKARTAFAASQKMLGARYPSIGLA